jgi:hypothetical protein
MVPNITPGTVNWQKVLGVLAIFGINIQGIASDIELKEGRFFAAG